MISNENKAHRITADDTPAPQKRRPLWGLSALILIGLITLSILYMANVQIRKDRHTNLFENGFLPVRVEQDDGSHWGYLNKSGELAIPAVYDEALDFAKNGLAPVKQNGLWGYVNKKGELAIPCIYEQALGFGEGKLAPVKQNGLWGYANKKGELVIPCTYKIAASFAANGLAAVTVEDGKWGYINHSGKMVIDAMFEQAGVFDKENHAIVKAYGQWGVINKHGKFVINPQFDYLSDFSPAGLAVMKKGALFGYINRDGEYVIPPIFDQAAPFAENGLATASKPGELYCYVNVKGEAVIPALFNHPTDFASNGIAAVATWKVISPERSELCWQYIAEDGNAAFDGTFSHATPFALGLAAVCDENGWRYINKKGETAFTLAENCVFATGFCDDGYAAVECFDEQQGVHYIEIIDKTGNVIHTQRLLAFASR